MKGGDGWSVAVLIVQVFTERNCFEGHQSQNCLKSYRTIYSIVGGFLREGVRQGDKRVSDL